MKMKLIAAITAAASLASCVSGPATPKDAYLNRYVGAETVATQCPAYGGYGSVTQMRIDAEKNLAEARALGATDKDVAKARNRVNGTFAMAAALTSPMQACNTMLNSVAWAGTSKPVIVPPKKKPTTGGTS
jgi:hypothetical protein